MKKFLANIKTFIRSRTGIKTVIVLVMLGITIIHPTFAADTTNDTSSLLNTITNALDDIIRIAARARIPLAIIAGKLMTNEFVYGSFMHMDKYLWTIWNIMKNFANFGLAAMIIIWIIQYMKEWKSPQKVIISALIAGVGIQASWFIVGWLVDISTVLTSTIASFPSAFIWENDLKSSIQKWVDINMRSYKILINEDLTISKPDKNSEEKELQNNQVNQDKIREKIMPRYDSVSWPLIYMGMSSLRLQDFMDFVRDSDRSIKQVSINFALKFMITLFFTITLLLLCIANVIRIVFLWLVIIAAPLLILALAFWKKTDWGWSWVMKYLKVWVIINTIFKPVVFMGALSLMLIFIVSIQDVMWTKHHLEVNWVSLTKDKNTSTIGIENIWSLSVNDNFFNSAQSATEDAASIFTDLIIYFTTLFLMRFLIKKAATTWWWPIESAMEWATKTIEDFAKTTPIVPWWFSANSIWSGINQIKGWIEDKVWFNLKTGENTKAQQEAENRINKMFWLNKTRSSYEYSQLEREIREWGNYFGKLTEIAKNQEIGISLENSTIKAGIETFLSNQTKDRLKNNWFEIDKTKEKTFEQIFKDSTNSKKNIKTLHELLWWNENANTKDPDSYEKLIKNKYFGKE